MVLSEVTQKWEAVLDHPDLDKITDPHRRAVTAQLLENQEISVLQSQSQCST